MDNFTRFLVAIPTVRDRGKDATEALVTYFLTYGTPRFINSDRGVHFINEVFANLCDALDIHHVIHCAYRPQSSGNVERAHRTLKNAMWIIANDLKIDWEQALPYALRAFNCAPNAATGVSPYYAVYGRQPNVTGLEPEETDQPTPLEFGKKVARRLRVAHEAMKRSQKCADELLENRMNPHFSIPDLKAGDKVLVKRTQSTEAKRTNMDWIGPYTVLATNGFIVHIQINNTRDFVHREHCVLVRERKQHADDDDIPFWETETDVTNGDEQAGTIVPPAATANAQGTPPDIPPSPHTTRLPDSDSDEFHSPEFETPPERPTRIEVTGTRQRVRHTAPAAVRHSTRDRQKTDRWRYNELGGRKTRRK